MRELGNKGGELSQLLLAALQPPDLALKALPPRPTPLSSLQRAVCCAALGRVEEAREIVQSVGRLPAGLEAWRRSWTERQAGETSPVALPDRKERTLLGVASPTLAALHLSQGDTETAIVMYRELLEWNPEDAEIRRRLQALLGEEVPREPMSLEGWLERVRAWRGYLGV